MTLKWENQEGTGPLMGVDPTIHRAYNHILPATADWNEETRVHSQEQTPIPSHTDTLIGLDRSHDLKMRGFGVRSQKGTGH